MTGTKSTHGLFLVVRASFLMGDLRPNGSCRSRIPLMGFPTAKGAEEYLRQQLSSAYLQVNPFREGDLNAWGLWSTFGDFRGFKEDLLATLAKINVSLPSLKMMTDSVRSSAHKNIIDWWDSVLPNLSAEQAQAVWSACENFYLLEVIEMPLEA